MFNARSLSSKVHKNALVYSSPCRHWDHKQTLRHTRRLCPIRTAVFTFSVRYNSQHNKCHAKDHDKKSVVVLVTEIDSHPLASTRILITRPSRRRASNTVTACISTSVGSYNSTQAKSFGVVKKVY